MFNGKRLYSVIRSHGLALHLLSYDDLLSFIDSEDLDRLLEKLKNTEYRRFFRTKEDLLDDREIEARINTLMYERISHILSLLDKRMEELVRAYLSKYDIEHLRRVIYSEKFKQEAPKELFPGEFFPGIRLLLEKKRRLPKEIEPIIVALDEWKESGEEDIVTLDLLLERAYLDLFQNKLKTRFIEKKVKELFFKYMEDRLIIACLRAIFCNEASKISILQRFIDPEIYDIISSTKNLDEILEKLSKINKFSSLIKKIITIHKEIKEPLLWEFIQFSDVLEKTSQTARRSPLSSPYIIWYVFRTEWEALAVRLLVIGKKEGVSDETLRKLLAIGSYHIFPSIRMATSKP